MVPVGPTAGEESLLLFMWTSQMGLIASRAGLMRGTSNRNARKTAPRQTLALLTIQQCRCFLIFPSTTQASCVQAVPKNGLPARTLRNQTSSPPSANPLQRALDTPPAAE